MEDVGAAPCYVLGPRRSGGVGGDGGPGWFAGATGGDMSTDVIWRYGKSGCRTYLMLVTSQSRATAALQMRLPRKPLPPQTTSFFFATVEDIVVSLADLSNRRSLEGSTSSSFRSSSGPRG